MEADIELLKKQVVFAHERIERLTKENWEFRMLIRALMFSHGDKQALAAAIEPDKELFVAIGLGKDVPDADLQFLQDKAARAISLLQSRQHGNS